ncbi:MAG: DUF6265 family protein [Candidatus Hodarchaeales archaeon]|jgi:hypothetical protein
MEELQAIGELLEGNWRGKIGNDIVDEYWSATLADSIMGMFRWEKAGKVSFYEFVVIDKIEDKIMLKIKHFHANLTGWEERTDFVHYVLHEVTATRIVFGADDPSEKGRLIYEQPSKDKLTATLEMAKQNQILRFEFNRIASSS